MRFRKRLTLSLIPRSPVSTHCITVLSIVTFFHWVSSFAFRLVRNRFLPIQLWVLQSVVIHHNFSFHFNPSITEELEIHLDWILHLRWNVWHAYPGENWKGALFGVHKLTWRIRLLFKLIPHPLEVEEEEAKYRPWLNTNNLLENAESSFLDSIRKDARRYLYLQKVLRTKIRSRRNNTETAPRFGS